MGLFKRHKKKQVQNDIGKNISDVAKAKEEKKDLKDSCDQILICDKKAQDAKIEYDAVTSYLKDMQQIELIPLSERLKIEDAARNILNLTKERNKFRNRERVISDQQYNIMELNEISILSFIPKLLQEEGYKVLIDQDIEKVEAEKERIEAEQMDTIDKQRALKHVAIGIGVITSFLFLTFALLVKFLQVDVKIPFTLSGVLVFLLAFFILNESYKNQRNIKIIDSKLKRAVYLYNKLAIKAVNNRSFLEYSYNKYLVQSGLELKNLYEEYIKLKDEERRYQSNTELLHYFQSQLIEGLSDAGVVDSEIWIYQTEAILDRKEMVEVRHRLNTRRQKLREMIDANLRLKDSLLQDINKSIELNPDSSKELISFIEWYKKNTN